MKRLSLAPTENDAKGKEASVPAPGGEREGEGLLETEAMPPERRKYNSFESLEETENKPSAKRVKNRHLSKREVDASDPPLPPPLPGCSTTRDRRKKEWKPIKMKTIIAGPKEEKERHPSKQSQQRKTTLHKDEDDEVEVKTLGPSIRKKSERAQLKGYDCRDCEAYYGALGLSEDQLEDKLKKCSRHRGTSSPPKTPEHFWDIDFPTTPECIRRGYILSSSQEKKKVDEDSF